MCVAGKARSAVSLTEIFNINKNKVKEQTEGKKQPVTCIKKVKAMC